MHLFQTLLRRKITEAPRPTLQTLLSLPLSLEYILRQDVRLIETCLMWIAEQKMYVKDGLKMSEIIIDKN